MNYLFTFLKITFIVMVICAIYNLVLAIYYGILCYRSSKVLELLEAEPYSVVGLIANQDRTKFLAIGRKNVKNHFSLPGGKIDPGETPFEALVRELNEELGITVVAARETFSEFDPPGKKCILFENIEFEGTPQSMEGPKLKWLTKKELTNKKICPFWQYNKRYFNEKL